MLWRAATTVGAAGGMILSYIYAPIIACAMMGKTAPSDDDDDDASVKDVVKVAAAVDCAEDTTANILLAFALFLIVAGTSGLVYCWVESCKTSTQNAYQGLPTPPNPAPPLSAAVGDDQI